MAASLPSRVLRDEVNAPAHLLELAKQTGGNNDTRDLHESFNSLWYGISLRTCSWVRFATTASAAAGLSPANRLTGSKDGQSWAASWPTRTRARDRTQQGNGTTGGLWNALVEKGGQSGGVLFCFGFYRLPALSPIRRYAAMNRKTIFHMGPTRPEMPSENQLLPYPKSHSVNMGRQSRDSQERPALPDVGNVPACSKRVTYLNPSSEI